VAEGFGVENLVAEDLNSCILLILSGHFAMHALVIIILAKKKKNFNFYLFSTQQYLFIQFCSIFGIHGIIFGIHGNIWYSRYYSWYVIMFLKVIEPKESRIFGCARNSIELGLLRYRSKKKL